MTWVVNMARLAGYQTDDFDTDHSIRTVDVKIKITTAGSDTRLCRNRYQPLPFPVIGCLGSHTWNSDQCLDRLLCQVVTDRGDAESVLTIRRRSRCFQIL